VRTLVQPGQFSALPGWEQLAVCLSLGSMFVSPAAVKSPAALVGCWACTLCLLLGVCQGAAAEVLWDVRLSLGELWAAQLGLDRASRGPPA
jgi:hypothetical protein